MLKELQLVSDEKISKNRIDYLYELIHSFPDMDIKSLIFLHLLAILKIKIPDEKYVHELLQMTTKQTKTIYGDIYLYFDYLYKEFFTFSYNYNSEFFKRKILVNNELLSESSSYSFSKRKKTVSCLELQADFSNRLIAMRQASFKKILDQNVQNLYNELVPSKTIKKNVKSSSRKMSRCKSLFQFPTKTMHNPNLFLKDNFEMREKIKKILSTPSNKYHVCGFKTNTNFNKSTSRNDISKKWINGKTKMNLQNNKMNERKIMEPDYKFSTKEIGELNKNSTINSNSNQNIIKANRVKVGELSKQLKGNHKTTSNSLSKFIQKKSLHQLNNNDQKKKIPYSEFSHNNLDPKDEITKRIKNRSSQKYFNY